MNMQNQTIQKPWQSQKGPISTAPVPVELPDRLDDKPNVKFRLISLETQRVYEGLLSLTPEAQEQLLQEFPDLDFGRANNLQVEKFAFEVGPLTKPCPKCGR
jgi:hypothetical protein